MLSRSNKPLKASWHPAIAEVGSVKELSAALIQLTEAKQMPAVVSVQVSKPPFLQKAIGRHFVNIKSFNAAKGLVEIDNQWGKTHDVTIPVQMLFDALDF